MDLDKLRIKYCCFYCKRNFGVEKEKLEEHWTAGCKRMRECYSSRLVVNMFMNLNSCKIFFNPKNIDIDIENVVLKNLAWPLLNFHFTTRNNWKTARQETYMDQVSEGED